MKTYVGIDKLLKVGSFFILGRLSIEEEEGGRKSMRKKKRKRSHDLKKRSMSASTKCPRSADFLCKVDSPS